ncbi:MAG TPA: FUSC family protein [Candidatus Binatia bacterium]
MTAPTTGALRAATRDASPDERRPPLLTRLAELLRTELAPSPARWRATARITVACVVSALLVMTFRIPYGHWFVISIFVVSQPNVGASIDKAILRILGTVLGAAGVIATFAAFPQQPWVLVPLIAAWIFAGMFLSRTSAYPYVAQLGAITVVMFLASDAAEPALSVTSGLWRVGAVSFAVVVATAAQLLVWPDDPEDLLLEDLAGILGAVEARLARTVAGERLESAGDDVQRLRDGAFNGLARQLDLLSNAESRYRALRRRHTEQLVLIETVNRIAVASLALETLLQQRDPTGRGVPIGDALAARLERVRAGVAELRDALVERRSLAAPDGSAADGAAKDDAAEIDAAARDVAAPAAGKLAGADPRDAWLLPPIVDLEDALEHVRPATAFLAPHGAASPEALGSVLDAGPPRFFGPTCTFSNVRDVRFAAQATIAAMICYLLVVGLQWPGIFTAIVTCLFVAQSSFGATVQKAILRLSGALLGGVLGIATLLIVVPNFDSLPPFLIAVALGTGIAAYVATGSARISYVGIQIAFAFALCTFDTWGPSVDLTRPRDRVLGILIGNLVTAGVTYWLWPVLAGRDMVNSLESALRHMALLSQVGVSGGVGERVVRPARGFRLQISQDLAATLRMHGEAQFEPGASTPEHRDEQRRLLALLQAVQGAFLVLLALVRNRLNTVPSRVDLPSRDRSHALAVAVAPNLEAAADELSGRPPRPAPAMAELVRAAEEAIAADEERIGDDADRRAALAVLASQLELYRELAPRIEEVRRRARAARAA